MPEIDFDYEITRHVLGVLKADARVQSIVNGGVHSSEPQGVAPASPYICLGPMTVTRDDGECLDAVTASIVIDCYSYGALEHGDGALLRKLANAVRKALTTEDAALSADSTVSISHVVTRHMTENNGELCRASVNMEGVADQPLD